MGRNSHRTEHGERYICDQGRVVDKDRRFRFESIQGTHTASTGFQVCTMCTASAKGSTSIRKFEALCNWGLG